MEFRIIKKYISHDGEAIPCEMLAYHNTDGKVIASEHAPLIRGRLEGTSFINDLHGEWVIDELMDLQKRVRLPRKFEIHRYLTAQVMDWPEVQQYENSNHCVSFTMERDSIYVLTSTGIICINPPKDYNDEETSMTLKFTYIKGFKDPYTGSIIPCKILAACPGDTFDGTTTSNIAPVTWGNITDGIFTPCDKMDAAWCIQELHDTNGGVRSCPRVGETRNAIRLHECEKNELSRFKDSSNTVYFQEHDGTVSVMDENTGWWQRIQ